ncbi:MAG: DUF6265 family protein [Flavobacterium sp.]
MKNLFLFLPLVLLNSCQKIDENKFEKLKAMDWLIGDWNQILSDGKLIENWKIENDSTYSAKNYFIKANDTIHSENIKLSQKNDELIYSAQVIGQNDDEFIDFKLTSTTENTFVFENPKHDYPQKITYKKVNSTTLMATISGKQNGKPSSENYFMKRTK